MTTKNQAAFEDEKIHLLRLPTPLHRMNYECENNLFIKRDDLTDFALGGNKARMMEFFLKAVFDEKCDCLVAYGPAQSNLCRIVSAAAARYKRKCVLILEKSGMAHALMGNAIFTRLAGAEIIPVAVDEVVDTIDKTLDSLRKEGMNPYFIPGGGHSPLGIRSYVAAWQEIQQQSASAGLTFDYLFLATGTGTTQAGLLIGKTEDASETKIVGISIARKAERGLTVLAEGFDQYSQLYGTTISIPQEERIFEDRYVGGRYGKITPDIVKVIEDVYRTDSIVLDPIYTAKAFNGMIQYLECRAITGKNILFLHTGGLPGLFGTGASLIGHSDGSVTG